MPPLNPFNRTCLALAIGQAVALPAQAATITVETADDVNGTACTLRDAISAANDNANFGACVGVGTFGADTIDFDLTQPATITLGSALPAITKQVTIDGPGADALTVVGGSNIRGFNISGVDANGTFISNLSITGGTLAGALNYGGAIRINDTSSVTLSHLAISGNTAPRGGGIYGRNADYLEIVNSTLSGNSAEANGGGITFGGGLTFPSEHVEIRNSTLSGNSAQNGGGITISTNTHYLQIVNSTLSGNWASAKGGGLDTFASASLDVINSILSGNRAGSGAGEVYNRGTSTFSTVTGNLFGDSGLDTTLAFENFTPGAIDNIIASSNSASLSLTQILDTTLADNGGPTLTHALPVNSPARDNADVGSCTAVDQRDAPRGTATCDIGAVEVVLGTVTVNNGEDEDTDCTLREAILSTNSGTPVGGCVAMSLPDTETTNRIEFDNVISGSTIAWTSVAPFIIRKVAINELGQVPVTLEGGPGIRGLSISGAGASGTSISALTVTGGNESGGGGILVQLADRVSLSRLTVSGNSANTNGGGLLVLFSDKLMLTNSTLSGNFAGAYGGGIYAGSADKLSIGNSTITNNSAVTYGGGLFAALSVAVSIQNSLLSGNRADKGGEVHDVLTTFLPAPSGNLFGDSALTKGQAFSGAFTPDPSDNIVASYGSSNLPLTGILDTNLADNGGSTLTHALVPNSPAIDAADQAFCADNGITTDQRGEDRDNTCDIGAFEFIDGQACFVINGAGGKTIVFCL